MPIRDIIHSQLYSCSADTTISDAVSVMKDNDTGSLLILEDEKPIGIVTDRDIVLRCVAEGKDCDTTTVDEIMTPTVETASLEDGVQDVIRLMQDNKVRRIVVCDEDGSAAGLLSFDDLFVLLAKEMGDLSQMIKTQRAGAAQDQAA